MWIEVEGNTLLNCDFIKRVFRVDHHSFGAQDSSDTFEVLCENSDGEQNVMFSSDSFDAAEMYWSSIVRILKHIG